MRSNSKRAKIKERTKNEMNVFTSANCVYFVVLFVQKEGNIVIKSKLSKTCTIHTKNRQARNQQKQRVKRIQGNSIHTHTQTQTPDNEEITQCCFIVIHRRLLSLSFQKNFC